MVDQEGDASLAVGDQAVKRRGAGAQRRRTGDDLLLEVMLSVVQQGPEMPARLPNRRNTVPLPSPARSARPSIDLRAARQAVLARIPHGSTVMTNTSVTLTETGIADAINDGGPYKSARNEMFALDFATQAQQMKAISGQPDFALGSAHAVTQDGGLVIASASGSQFASMAWGAANVIFVVGAQKIVPDLEVARERIYQHSLVLEDARAQAAYGQHSFVGKILEIRQELPGRVHVVLISEPVGY